MLKTDAAKPYLISLRNSSVKLVNLGKKINQESCKAIYETYADIENAELVLTPLGQMDYALEKEYKPAYAKAKEECSKVGKGVYIESDSEELAGKMASFFQNFGCDMAENISSASLTLSLKDIMVGEGCERGTDGRGFAYCYACVKKINLQDGKTGKSLYKEGFKSSRGSYKDMETACKMALENTPQELWNKMQGKIKKENCK
jgi:hypothetical protein